MELRIKSYDDFIERDVVAPERRTTNYARSANVVRRANDAQSANDGLCLYLSRDRRYHFYGIHRTIGSAETAGNAGARTGQYWIALGI